MEENVGGTCALLAAAGRPCKYGCGRPGQPSRPSACYRCEQAHRRPGTHNSALAGRDSRHWAGTSVGYWAVHKRLRRMRGAARDLLCVDCGEQALDWAYMHNDVNEQCTAAGMVYSTDIDNYQAMCRACHKRYDRLAE